MGWLSKVWKGLFGSSDKGAIEQIGSIADNYLPGEVTKHKMSIEDMQAGDASQESARNMQLPTHDTWFDVAVDGINRLPRPIITFWVISMLFGWVSPPMYFAMYPPLVLNIIWTVIGFWFGSRMIIKDIPAAFKLIKSLRGK